MPESYGITQDIVILSLKLREEAVAKLGFFNVKFDQVYNASKTLVLAPKFPKSSYHSWEAVSPSHNLPLGVQYNEYIIYLTT